MINTAKNGDLSLSLRTIVNNINESKGVHKKILSMELRGSRFSGVSFTLLTDFHLEDFCCRWRTLQRSCFTSMKMSWALASNVGTPRNYFYTDILIYCIYRHMYMYAYLHPYIHAYVLTYMHTYVRTYVYTHIRQQVDIII